MWDRMECLNMNLMAAGEVDNVSQSSSYMHCNSGLGPCDLSDPVWVKMSAAVSGGATKKRKKTDIKSQQSQMAMAGSSNHPPTQHWRRSERLSSEETRHNKRDNEKRRRMQENTYIEELARLISATVADMNRMSSKPDKTEILQKTVDQIRTIREQEGVVASDAVQQGEVSSSKPTILPNEVFGPLLLEALEGFLFVVNTEGKVEYVTDNVSQFIKYSKDDVLGESIYNIIHHGDHARFNSLLVPITIGSIGWTSDPPVQKSNRSFNCRLLIKPPDDQNETMEQKQQRVSKYETMQISSTLLPYPNDKAEGGDVTSESAEIGPCLMCVARRIEKPVQQFTMKLDVNGKIIGVDTTNVSPPYSHYLNKELVGRIMQELCHQQEDLMKMSNHLKETLHNGHGTSAPYKMRITTPDKYVQVQTKSKLFKSNATHATEPDFIMSTHSIIEDADMPMECGHLTPSALSSPRALLPASGGSGGSGGSSTSSVGGPLIIGSNGQVPSRGRNGNVTSTGFAPASDPTAPSELTFNDLNDLFPHSTWDLGENSAGTPVAPWNERPDSRQSLTPVSTRPPSVPSYSPASAMCPSPVFTAVQPPSTTPYNMFPFSPPAEPPINFMDDSKDCKDSAVEIVNGGELSNPSDSGRLRNLLTKRPSTSDEGGEEGESKYRHPILKELLDQEDEEGEEQASPANRGMAAARLNPPEAKVAGGNNNMLLKLLNNRDDDDVPGIKKQDELFQQLLKEPEESKTHMDTGQPPSSQDDPLLKTFGITTSPPGNEMTVSSLIGARKRPSNEGDEQPAKRPAELSVMHHVPHPQVSSSQTGNSSKLCEKNKMLASLLAKKPNQTTTIPSLPPSVISATPQSTMDRIKVSRQMSIPVPPSTQPQQPPQQRQQQQQQSRPFSLHQQPDQHTAGMLHMQKLQQQLMQQQQQAQQQQQQQQQQQHQQQLQQQQLQRNHSMSMEAPVFAQPQGSPGAWDNSQFDPFLSDILDEVIDFVPDGDPSSNMNMNMSVEPTVISPGNFQQDMNEKMAINEITKALMSCESVVKSPSSPTVSMPGTPPAYTTAANQSSQGFPPPPLYQQRPRYSVQGGTRSQAPQYMQGMSTPQLMIQQQRNKLMQQQQQQMQKERLLQQQQQQQMLIPSNARDDQHTPNMQNMESLLNNAVAPNVSLQRSSSVPDAQLSPGYNRQPYSPHAQLASPFSPNNFTPAQQGSARLSPHPPGSLPSFQQSQLSPRISQQGQQQGYGNALSQQVQQGTSSWSQTAARLSLQQQQNPMLNAQLTGSYGSPTPGRTFASQRQQLPSVRSLPSPGAPGSQRQPSYPGDQFPPPASPTQVTYSSQQQFQQQMRLQRTISAPPSATTQLPGGLNSPRHYNMKPEHPLHPYHSHHHPPHPMMYQQPDGQQFCFDQASLQLYGTGDRRSQPHHTTNHQPGGGGNNGMTSEYVRQELRAIVGARTQQGQMGGRTQPGQQVSPVDLEALGLSYEMQPTGASDNPKLWGNIGSDLGSDSPQAGLVSRNSMEESPRPGDQKASLLQKLLSE